MSSRFSYTYVCSKAMHTCSRLFVRPPVELAEVPGYLHSLEGRFLFWLAGRVPSGGLALEVGSFKGKSSGFLAADLRDGAHLACVDTWRNDAMIPFQPPFDVMAEFLRNTKHFSDRIETHRGTSSEVAAEWTRPIDILFIDGDHSYEGCARDINAWLPFVRRGGWIAFHDTGHPDVARAIADLFPRSRRYFSLAAWSIFAAKKR